MIGRSIEGSSSEGMLTMLGEKSGRQASLYEAFGIRCQVRKDKRQMYRSHMLLHAASNGCRSRPRDHSSRAW